MSKGKREVNQIDFFLIVLSNYLYMNQQTKQSSEHYFEIFTAVKSISKKFVKNSQEYHEIEGENSDIVFLTNGEKDQLLDIVEEYFDEIYDVGTQPPPSTALLEYSEELTDNCLAVLIDYLQGTSDIQHRQHIITAIKIASPSFFEESTKPGFKSSTIISRLNNTTKNKLLNIFTDFHAVFSEYLSLKNASASSLNARSVQSGQTSNESLSTLGSLSAKSSKQGSFNSSDFSEAHTFSTLLSKREEDYSDDFESDEEYRDDFEEEKEYPDDFEEDKEYPDDFEEEKDRKNNHKRMG